MTSEESSIKVAVHYPAAEQEAFWLQWIIYLYLNVTVKQQNRSQTVRRGRYFL